ncbi:hypothetical protein SAMN05421831_11221 [Allopseudospirillum japonicum]|uniref:VCBS repeat-containing protein n=1 Tax=Allopseudospirillum japonicum TaxID=64971 RepID=A0A1H6U1U3_9GAMM|nr:hypothetical protein [Allopseudospirillum japonicum]SEI83527.1 hypothetical protein SAMN05421831_11221 [Allopseudospirillum japonicum]
MFITQSNVNLQSERQAYQHQNENVHWRYIERGPRGEISLEGREALQSTKVELSREQIVQTTQPDTLQGKLAKRQGQPWLDASHKGNVQGREKSQIGESELSVQDKLKVTLMQSLFEKTFGIRIQVQHFKMDTSKMADQCQPYQKLAEAQPLEIEQASGGWRLDYHRQVEYYEGEHTQFMAQGQVKTADGRELDISLELNMRRDFYTQHQEHIRVGTLKDPLVVNFDAPAAALQQRHFRFDVDADGREDEIAQLASGSGYLALDKNQDGVINDGSELFGTQSGNGFADLSAYDEDGNGFIDEGDSVFGQLKIWMMDEAGQSHLFSLQDKNIGALYLGAAQTPFSLTTSTEANQLGQVTATGFFLREDGSSGSLQQIDLKI